MVEMNGDSIMITICIKNFFEGKKEIQEYTAKNTEDSLVGIFFVCVNQCLYRKKKKKKKTTEKSDFVLFC